MMTRIQTLCWLAANGNLDEIIKNNYTTEEINTNTRFAVWGDPPTFLGSYNALFMAASYRHLDVVKYFVDKKQADIFLRGAWNYTALDCAKHKWWFGPAVNSDVVRYLERETESQSEKMDRMTWSEARFFSRRRYDLDRIKTNKATFNIEIKNLFLALSHQNCNERVHAAWLLDNLKMFSLSPTIQRDFILEHGGYLLASLGDLNIELKLSVLSTLLELACRNKVNQNAILELPDSVPTLVSLLNDSDANVVRFAAGTISNLAGWETPGFNKRGQDLIRESGAIPILASLLKKRDVAVPKTTEALMTSSFDNILNQQAIASTDALITLEHLAATHTDRIVRENAHEIIGACQKPSIEIQRNIFNLTQSNLIEKTQSVVVLCQLSCFPANHVEIRRLGGLAPLVKLLIDRDITVKQFAAHALMELTINALNREIIGQIPEAITSLINLLSNDDVEVRLYATWALTHLAANEKNGNAIRELRGIPILMKLTGDTDSRVREKATTALRNLALINPKNKSEIEELKRKSKSEIEELKRKVSHYNDRLHTEVAGFEARASNIQNYLKEGADINFQNTTNGYSALMIAVDAQNDRIAEYLLKQSANPLLLNKAGEKASDLASSDAPIYQKLKGYELVTAALSGNLSAVKLAINTDAYINFKGVGGYTALLIAVENNYVAIVTFLLSRGADSTLTRDDGQSSFDLVTDESILALLENERNCNENQTPRFGGF